MVGRDGPEPVFDRAAILQLDVQPLHGRRGIGSAPPPARRTGWRKSLRRTAGREVFPESPPAGRTERRRSPDPGRGCARRFPAPCGRRPGHTPPRERYAYFRFRSCSFPVRRFRTAGLRPAACAGKGIAKTLDPAAPVQSVPSRRRQHPRHPPTIAPMMPIRSFSAPFRPQRNGTRPVFVAFMIRQRPEGWSKHV